MKTHMSNTQAFKLQNDVVGHQHFQNHQKALHSNVKPVIDNKRKSEVKIVKNNKLDLNNNPKQHVQKLYTNLYNKEYKSNIDNKVDNYKEMKALLSNKIKRSKYEIYQENEHLREVRSMKNRVQNCKNMQQRKKDNTDPIVNPTYFIKPSKEAQNVTIDAYSKKILGMNRPKSAVTSTSKNFKQMSAKNEQVNDIPLNKYFGGVPSFSKERPKTSTMKGATHNGLGSADDLPGCSFKQILNHIVNHKLFKDVQMKVLYVRLCHNYGQENVNQIWEDLMDELQK